MVHSVKAQLFLQNRVDFVYSLVPNVIQYIEWFYDEYSKGSFYGIDLFESWGRYDDDRLKRGKYRTQYIDGYKYLFIIYTNRIYISRTIETHDQQCRKTPVIVESCILNRNIDTLRILQLPIRIQYHTDLGRYTVFTYKNRLLQPNYCSYCNQYFTNLKSHCKCKKHNKNISICVNDALKNNINIDCINSIIEYL